jgi:hypothetical protein
VVVQSESPGAIDEQLISPMFRVSASDSTLRFRWLGNPFWAGAANATCRVRRKGEVTWTDVWSLQPEPQALAFEYPTRVVSLSPWLADSIQVGFRVAGTNGPDFAVDDIATGQFALTAPPLNDLCAAAVQLPAGTFTVTGTTCYAANNRNPYGGPLVSSCVPYSTGGGDVFYKFDALNGDTLSVAVTDNTNFRAYIYVLDSCDSLAAICVAGEGSADPQDTPSFRHVFNSPGTYYLVVDSEPNACGNFELAVDLHGPVTGVPPLAGELGRMHLAAAPNPARSTIGFTLSAPIGMNGSGMLRLYDLRGRRIAERAVTVTAGRGAAAWDGRDASGTNVRPGVYVARWEVGGEKASTTVTLLR